MYIPEVSQWSLCISRSCFSTQEQAVFAWSTYYFAWSTCYQKVRKNIQWLHWSFFFFFYMTGAKSPCNLYNTCRYMAELESDIPASCIQTIHWLSFKIQKEVIELMSIAVPLITYQNFLPLLQPSTRLWLCNPQMSMRCYNHFSKCIYPAHWIRHHLLDAAHGCGLQSGVPVVGLCL